MQVMSDVFARRHGRRAVPFLSAPLRRIAKEKCNLPRSISSVLRRKGRYYFYIMQYLL